MSVSDEEFIDLIQKNGVRKTSIIINRNIRNVNRRRRKLEEKYGPINRDASVNATSTLYDAEGNTILQWVKRKAEREEQEKLLNEIALALSYQVYKIVSWHYLKKYLKSHQPHPRNTLKNHYSISISPPTTIWECCHGERSLAMIGISR